jgi:hypothetical protein
MVYYATSIVGRSDWKANSVANALTFTIPIWLATIDHSNLKLDRAS